METESKDKSEDRGNNVLVFTRPPKKQEYCAFAFLAAKEPKDDVHGVLKIICTGSSVEEVENFVKRSLKDGVLESELPTIHVKSTGAWVPARRNPKKGTSTKTFDVATQEVLEEVDEELERESEKAIMDMERKKKKLEKESQAKIKIDPDSFKTYISYVVGHITCANFLERQKKIIQESKKTLSKNVKARKQLDRSHPQYRKKLETDHPELFEQLIKIE